MPDSKVSLSSLIKAQRKVGSSRTGSIVKAAGQSVLQSIDPRNYLFNRSGVLASLFPSLKGYRPSTGGDNLSSASKSLTPDQVGVMTNQLDDIKMGINTVARNTMILPQMAKEMNIIRQNIIQLVKASGETPRQRASGFFQRAAGTEAEYESRLSKTSTGKSPTQLKSTGESSEKKGFFSGLFGSIFGGLFDIIKKPLLFALAGFASAYLFSSNFREKINEFLDGIFSSILGDENWKKIKEVVSEKIADIKSSLLPEKRPLTPEELKERRSENIKKGLGGVTAAGAAYYGKKGLMSAQDKLNSKVSKVNERQTKDAIKKAKTAFEKIFKKGGMTAIRALGYAIGKKFGYGIALKIFAMIVGTFITGPIGLVLSAAFIAANLYTVYQIIDYATGPFLTEYFGDDKEPELQDIKPEQINPQISKTPSETITGAKSSSQQRTPTSPTKLSDTQGLSQMDLSSLTPKQLQMANLIYQRFTEAGFTPEQAMGAIKNAYAESRLDPNASNTNGEDSWGLFQLNRKGGGPGEGYSPEQLKNPEANIGIMINEALTRNTLEAQKFRTATTVDEATEAFMKGLEIPKDRSATAVAKRNSFLSTESPIMVAQGPEQQLNDINRGDSIKSMSENINSNNFIAGEIQKLGGLLQLFVPQSNNQNIVMPSSGIKGSVIDEELAKTVWQDSY